LSFKRPDNKTKDLWFDIKKAEEAGLIEIKIGTMWQLA